MTKKIVSASMAISAVLALSGCGSSSSTPTTATGTAYYVDSAVSGVNYKCGTTEGITGTDGEFTFEVDASCTFYLGDIELRSVDAELLVDGGDVQETDIEIARILQSLDSDGNPDNGITIDAKIVQAMEDAGITKLPETQAEMEEMLAVVEAAGATVVSEADAVEHLLTNLLVGKTLYQHWSDGENDDIVPFLFGADGELVMGEGDNTETITYRIEGNVVYTMEEDGEKAHPIAEISDEYIRINETSGSVTTFYFTREAALAAPAMMDSGDNGSDNSVPTEFTQEVVSANPWYTVEYGVENGSEVAYCGGVFTYDGNNNLSVSWNDDGVPESETGSYSIVDGKVVTSHDGKTDTQTLSSYTDTVITTDKVTVEADSSTHSGNLKWFKNQTDAENFLNTYGESSCF